MSAKGREHVAEDFGQNQADTYYNVEEQYKYKKQLQDTENILAFTKDDSFEEPEEEIKEEEKMKKEQKLSETLAWAYIKAKSPQYVIRREIERIFGNPNPNGKQSYLDKFIANSSNDEEIKDHIVVAHIYNDTNDPRFARINSSSPYINAIAYVEDNSLFSNLGNAELKYDILDLPYLHKEYEPEKKFKSKTWEEKEEEFRKWWKDAPTWLVEFLVD